MAYNNYPVWGGQKEPIAPHEIAMAPSPDGVEIVARGEGADKITMYINHNATTQMVGEVELAPFECKILT